MNFEEFEDYFANYQENTDNRNHVGQNNQDMKFSYPPILGLWWLWPQGT